MTFLHKAITSLALVGMTLAPVAASAHEVSAPKDWRGDRGAEMMTKMKRMMGVVVHPGMMVGVRARAGGDMLAQLDNDTRAIVAKVRQLINAYRKSVHEADVQYKKSVHEARAKLTEALRVAIKAKDKAAGYAAFEAYFKAEGEVETKQDAMHAEARNTFMAELKVVLGL